MMRNLKKNVTRKTEKKLVKKLTNKGIKYPLQLREFFFENVENLKKLREKTKTLECQEIAE